MLKHFQNFQTAFRLELLQNYDVDDEQTEFQDFLKTNQVSANHEWVDIIKAARQRNALMSRVHVLQEPYTDYIRYELAKYRFNQEAGEQIYLLTQKIYDRLALTLRDFWLFDNKTVLQLKYDAQGKFLGHDQLDSNIEAYLEAKVKILQAVSTVL
jgi:hypothetical protein